MPIKVRVRDFQSIEDATLEIDGFTVVTGTNNAGKSAFFRALRGAFSNARGHDFVRQGKPHCTVDVEFDDGRTLTWKKGKGVNTYVVDGKELPKVGHGVPAEAQVFGISPIRVGNAELWPQIAPQITGVSFLLHETGSVVAEAVADVERVNQLSRALKSCESDRRSTRADLKVRRKDATVLATRMERYEGLDEAVEMVEALEQKHREAKKSKKAASNLGRMRDRLVVMRAVVRDLEGLEEAETHLPAHERVGAASETASDLREVETLQAHLKVSAENLDALSGLDEVGSELPSEERVRYAEKIREAITMTSEIRLRHEQATRELQDAVDAEKISADVSFQETDLSLARKLQRALANAQGLKQRFQRESQAIAGLDQEIEEARVRLENLKDRAKSLLGGYEDCPTCGGGLDHVH